MAETGSGTISPTTQPAGAERLDSWKAIATYLRREVRTVQRWEKSEGLPIHRHFHNRSGTVFAFKSEIDAWWAERRLRLEEQAGESTSAESGAVTLETPASDLPAPEFAEPEEVVPALPLDDPAPPPNEVRRGVIGAAALLVIALAGFIIWRVVQQRAAAFEHPAATPNRRMVLAVLPFLNLSGDPGQEYFADGLTEEMITDLGLLNPQSLGVIARTSAMKYKNTTEDIHQIGQELGADYVLEGSVRRQGRTVRVSAQLIQASDQTHLWAQSYDRQAKDVIGVQDELARAIADNIQLTVAPGTQTRVAGRAVNPEAYDAYLKGRYYWNKRTPADLSQALDYFNQAIAIDPAFAQAYVGLADYYNLVREYTSMPADQAYPKALEAAQKAIELDDNSAEGHCSLAFVLFYWKWDAAGAEREFTRALALNPNYVTTHHWHATYLMTVGRFRDALAEIERARALDPTSSAILADRGLILYSNGRLDEAMTSLKQLEMTEPEFLSPHRYLSTLYFEVGDYSNYLAESRKAAQLLHDAAGIEIVDAAEKGLAAGGRQGMLEGTLRVQKKLYEQGKVHASNLAQTYALMGRKQEALQYLQVSYEKREDTVLALGVDIAFRNLHQEPAFRDLLSRIGISPVK